MGDEIWKQMEKKFQEMVLNGRSCKERAAWRTGAYECSKNGLECMLQRRLLVSLRE
jgi:hypothetical protein